MPRVCDLLQRAAIALGVAILVLAWPGPALAAQSVTSFTLINADTDQPVAGFSPIPSGAVLDLSKLPTRRLNIRANTSPTTVGSVKFGFDFSVTYRIENVAPYALGGDTSGNYGAWTPTIGSHVVVATPYSGSNASGTKGTSLKLSFTVKDGTTTTSTPGSTHSVAGFAVLNADTGQPIAGLDPLPEGAVLDLSKLPANLALIAKTSPSTVGSVRFDYNGFVGYRTENQAPYALAGDSGGKYLTWTPRTGANQVTATPYSGSSGSGSKGTVSTRNFTVVTSTTTPSPSTPPGTAVPSVQDRVAISSDGNHHDPDDITATAMSLAILAQTGNAQSLVYYGYADHFWGARNFTAEEQMRVSAVETALRWGGFDQETFHNVAADKVAAVSALTAQINASSSTDRLWIIGAGPMELIGQAVAASQPAKRQYVTLVSHSLWNDTHAQDVLGKESWGITGWTYNEIVAMGVHGAHLVDQNAGLQRPYSEYTWLRDSTDPRLRWLWCRSQSPACPEFSTYAPGSGLSMFDASDAGMVYWLVTGDQGATPAKLKALFTGGL